MHYLFYNGQFYDNNDPIIKQSDRGFLLGDGVFTTLLIKHGQACFLSKHLERLSHNLQSIGLPYPISHCTISDILSELIEKNHLQQTLSSARITLTRDDNNRGLRITEQATSNLLIQMTPLPSPALAIEHLQLCHIRRNEFSPLSQIKSVNYLDMILAKRDAQQARADDALLLNTQGNIACTTSANVYFVMNDTIITPPLTDGVLPGIVRHLLLQSDLPIKEASISPGQFKDCQAILISNSLIGINVITRISNQTQQRIWQITAPHPLIEKMQQYYAQLLA